MKKKKFLIAYSIVACIGFAFILTGYSFTKSIFNYILIGLISLFPIVKGIQLLYAERLKSVIIVIVIFAIFLIGRYFLSFIAFNTAGTMRVVKVWTTGQFQIVLTRNQDWAGPMYYKYTLKRTALYNTLEKKLAEFRPGTVLTDSCIIDFKKSYAQDGHFYRFDKCDNLVKRMK